MTVMSIMMTPFLTSTEMTPYQILSSPHPWAEMLTSSPPWISQEPHLVIFMIFQQI